MDGKEKIQVSYDDYLEYVNNLRRKYDDEYEKYFGKLQDQYHKELRKWFSGHFITDSKS